MKPTLVAVFLCGLVAGQAPPAKLAFEVASIRPGLSGHITPDAIASGRIHIEMNDARADFGSISLSALIEMAYRTPWDRITGPGWMMDQRFDILAKLPEGAIKEQIPEMLQTLLEERFKVALHHDQKGVPVYALTVAKDSPNLRESPAGDSSDPGCNGGVRKVCRKMSMQALADQLTRISQLNASVPVGDLTWGVDRPVVDMTGLTGVYDFDLEYGRARAGGGRGPGAAAGADAGGRSVSDALKDLGLKLEPTKHTFDILVIDHLERVPTDN